MPQSLIRSRQRLEMRNHGAKAAVLSALELIEINFAFPACCFPKQFPRHRFSTHSNPAVNLPSPSHNAGGAESLGTFQMLCFRKRLGMEAGRFFDRLYGLGTDSVVTGRASGLRLHISMERLRAQPCTIANNSNRRINILIVSDQHLNNKDFITVPLLSCES